MVDLERIWTSRQLPTLPTVAIRLLEASKDPNVEVREIVEIVRTDPAIAAKILKATNSSYFGFRSKVTSLERAVPLLGTTVVISLALSFSLVETKLMTGAMGKHYHSYWMQSAVQAAVAETLGESRRKGLGHEYFLTGLLVDIGRLAMLRTIPQEYLPVLEEAERRREPLHVVEQESLGTDHIEIGCRLMQDWKLPDPVILAAEHHHADVERLSEQQDCSEFELLYTIAMASAAGDYYCTAAKGHALERLHALGSAFLGFDRREVEQFLEQVSPHIEETADLLSIDVAQLPEPAELMAQANEHLAQLALREHAAGTEAMARERQIQREKAELESEHRRLRKKAVRDPLTQVFNRQLFDTVLQREIHRARRDAHTIGVIFADLDRFKSINDTLGHQFGDYVLQRVATVLRQQLRRSDVLARYGGEEFVVLVARPTEKGLARIAERLRAAVEAESIVRDAVRIPVTVSVGAAIGLPGREDDDLASRLIAEADAAMYDSKRAGRNRVHIRVLIADSERRILQLATQRRFSRWLVSQHGFDKRTVAKALLDCRRGRARLGELAVRYGYLSSADVSEILETQKADGLRFGQAALRLGRLNEDQLINLLALQGEDPVSLAAVLTKNGVAPQGRMSSLVRQYLAEVTSSSGNAAISQNKVDVDDSGALLETAADHCHG